MGEKEREKESYARNSTLLYTTYDITVQKCSVCMEYPQNFQSKKKKNQDLKINGHNTSNLLSDKNSLVLAQ